jgi:hypothetical protein
MKKGAMATNYIDPRLALHHGPYYSPRVQPGRRLLCEIRGTVMVWRFSDGPIPWPLTPSRGPGGVGGEAFILYGDLLGAVRLESLLAV